MLRRKVTVVTVSPAAISRRTFITSHKPWHKLAHLLRQPMPKPLERLRIEARKVEHPTTPVAATIRGQEHVVPIDIDYMHVIPEDERVGLVLKGLHPRTRIYELRTYLGKHSYVRHCWIHSEGTICVRFQDEESKERAQSALKEQEGYPFHIYDENRRNWLGQPPPDQPPLSIYPLTVSYDHETPVPERVLVMRSLVDPPDSVMALFESYNEPNERVTALGTKFQAHDRWIWEYYLRFPTMEKASEALETYGGKEITIPYKHLSTIDKLHFPYGKTLHLWLRHTGLNQFPRPRTLQGQTFYPRVPLYSLQSRLDAKQDADE